MKKLLCTLLVLGLVTAKLYAQDYSKNSLTYGIGFGAVDSDNDNYTGLGPAFMIGYKRDVWKDRIRFNPNLTIGNYRDGMKDTGRDIHFSTVDLNVSFEFDFLKYRAISFTVETGALIGSTSGLKGTGLVYNAENSSSTMATQSEQIKSINAGVLLGLGLRIAPPKSRFAIKISPVHYRRSSAGMRELHGFLSLDVRLK